MFSPGLVLLLAGLAAGCPDPDPQFADAAVDGSGADAPDAAVDGAGDGGPDAPGGTHVTVHVRRVLGDGSPDVDATVFHAAADGTLRATLTPDTAGVVLLTVDAGDSVTVRPGGSFPLLTTVAGVEPGDVLWFGSPALFPAGEMTVTVPENQAASGYAVTGPCQNPRTSDTTTLTVAWRDGCPATRTVVLIAEDAGTVGGDQVFIAPLTVMPDAAVVLDGPWVDAADESVAVIGAPPGMPVAVAGTLMVGDETVPIDLAYDDSPPAVRWQRPPALDDGVLLRVQHGDGLLETLQRLPPATRTVDVTQRVPVVTSVDETPQLSWTVSAPDPIDAFVVNTSSSAGKGVTASWTFVLPPDARTLVRPQIPGAPPTAYASLQVVDVAGAGYAQFRTHAGELDRYRFLKPPVGHDVQYWTTGD